MFFFTPSLLKFLQKMEFTRSGIQLIQESLCQLLETADVPERILSSANSFFRLPCMKQYQEKVITEETKAEMEKQPALEKHGVALKTTFNQIKKKKSETLRIECKGMNPRKKHSKKTAYVAASIQLALKDAGIPYWENNDMLRKAMGAEKLTRSSINSARKEIEQLFKELK